MYRRVVMPFTILALITLMVCLDDQASQAQIGGYGKKKGQGGGKPGGDSSGFFNMISKGKEYIVIDEVQMGKEAMMLFAQREGITDGKLTREQFAKYLPQWRTLAEEARKGGVGKGAGASGDKKAAPTSPDKSMFERMAKGKEFIVIEEIQMGKDAMLLFAQREGITDGKITREQFAKFQPQWRTLAEEARKSGAGKSVGPDPEKLFKRFDTNGDGFLNESEIAQTTDFKNQWQKWDADKDGKISLDEWKAYRADADAQRAAKGEKGKGRNEFRQTDKAPSVSVLEIEETENTPVTVFRYNNLPEGLPPWFKELDTNKDGQVSFKEWLKADKPASEFIRMDRNDDGLLTPEEVLRYLRSTQTASAKGGEEESTIVLIGPDGEEPPPRTEAPGYKGKSAMGKDRKQFDKGEGKKKKKKG